jgi:RNA-binding motif X-linked protein 2
MRDYLIQKRREEKALKKPKKHKSKGKHKDETPEERKARKARKKEKKAKKVKSEGMRAVESLLSNLGRRDLGRSPRSRSRSPGEDRPHRRSRSPIRYRASPPGRRERASDDHDYEARNKRSRYSDDDRSRDFHRQGSDSRSSKRTRDFD